MPKRKRIPVPPPSAQRETMQQVVADTIDGDLFQGYGHFDPSGYVAIARTISALEPKSKRPKPRPIKPPPAKKAAKKKPAPKPKKGKKIAKVNEVCLRSPFTGKPQWMPLVSELSELLAEGWEIVDADDGIEAAQEFLSPKELQRV